MKRDLRLPGPLAFLVTTVAFGTSALAAWPPDGLHVNDLGNPSAMVGDGSGGVFLTWGVQAVQRISADGDLLLPPGPPLLENVSEALPGFSAEEGGV